MAKVPLLPVDRWLSTSFKLAAKVLVISRFGYDKPCAKHVELPGSPRGHAGALVEVASIDISARQSIPGLPDAVFSIAPRAGLDQSAERPLVASVGRMRRVCDGVSRACTRGRALEGVPARLWVVCMRAGAQGVGPGPGAGQHRCDKGVLPCVLFYARREC